MMPSPTKMVAAAAVGALAGVLLLAGPFTQEDGEPAAPVALSDLPAVTLVSGQVADTDGPWSMGTVEAHEWGYSVTGSLSTMAFEMDDERLSGLSRFRINAHAKPGTYAMGPIAASVFLKNDGGSWVGTGQGYQDPAATGGAPAAGHHFQLAMEGQDGYEGLTAVVTLDQPDEYSPYEVTGAIMPLDPAPMPGAAPMTFGAGEG